MSAVSSRPPKRVTRPAAVLVQGAGNDLPYVGLARFLAQRGIAVLAYDKRGVGDSGGTYVGPEVGTNNVSRENLNLLAEDAVAVMHVMHREKRLDGVPCGLVGVSQAGWIIPLAALKDPDMRFMVLWSGAVETTHEDMITEQLALPDPEFWDHHTHEDVQRTMRQTVDHFDWPNLDPRDALSKLAIPGLGLFGDVTAICMSICQLDG
ncbi:MAG: alpha/beta hydrolase family protein [Steroidobacteraceae bacterium]